VRWRNRVINAVEEIGDSDYDCDGLWTMVIEEAEDEEL
jgi:hypothetical protein